MVNIVLVNWNSGDFLNNCLRTIIGTNNETLISKIYIIDNNTTDTSLDQIPASEKIELIRNKENSGFAKACNQGFKLCTAPFVLLLNPDTQLFDSTLQDCLHFMQDHPEVDIAGCQLLNEDGSIAKTCARFPTPLRMCFEATGLAKIAPGIFTPASLMTDWDHKESRFVDQVMGAFMFIRRPVFEKAGYFDERFFVYYEELDFSERLAKLGGKSFYTTTVKAIHSGGGTTHKVKGFRLFLNLRSRLQYAKKHFSYPAFAMVGFCTFFIEPFSRMALLLFSGRFSEMGSIYKGYKLLIASLPIR
jgi:N-acetylglucosaminyl-diphospho-decaprenol L-rhamnosyltransferase